MSSLKLVEFIDTNNQPVDGLISVNDNSSIFSPHEKAILLQAASYKQIDYVYFRRFIQDESDFSRSSQVAAYVIDNSDFHLTEDDLAILHHNLWLHGVAPLVYVAWPTRIDILTCARTPDFWDVSGAAGVDRYKYAARIEPPEMTTQIGKGQHAITTASEIAAAFEQKRRQFSAHRLGDGTFWDDPDNQTLANDEKAAHRSLIQAIVEADRKLEGEKYRIRRRLLVLVILIKYLEDRKVFPSSHFGKFHPGAETFFDILHEGTVQELMKLLGFLEDKFNGDVFSLDDDYSELTQGDMRTFATLVAGDELGYQKHFWKLFSFEYIPVEVISRLYQRFVTGHGAIYTPQLLASLLLDQVMPYKRMTGKEKVLDPACGSGIFLVGAFKRLVNHWRSCHEWQKPSVENLLLIVSDSIHGVEMESGAVDLTAFSLALAVCDALDPPLIWNSLKFNKLRGNNLLRGDFFDQTTFTGSSKQKWPDKFDVIIGNPPFESQLTSAAKLVDSSRPKKQTKLPDKQVAYLFLEQCLKLLASRGELCLIQPHGLIYNTKTAQFMKHLMNICQLHTILDFVSIRGMFEGKDNLGADAKPIAWHAIQGEPSERPINHLTFRRTFSTSERLGFEIDHYDWHYVTRMQIEDNPLVWRAGLIGGGRLQTLALRFRSMRTLAAFIAGKGSHWAYGEGFIAGKNGKPAEYLTDKPFLPTSAFNSNGIVKDITDKVKETRFSAPRKRELFQPPLVLIKEHESLPIAYWNDGELAYQSTIVGIHSPLDQQTELLNIYNLLQTRNRLYRFCCALNGTRALVSKATSILKNDIDQLPFPEDTSELELAFWEDALKEDVLNYMSDYVRLGQDSMLLKNTAGNQNLIDYSSLFVRMLGSLYRNLQAHEPIFLNGLTAQPFYFGVKPDVSWLGKDCETTLEKLIYDNSRESLRTMRVVRYYENNVILIIKPNRLRYWIRSTAIRDADDTLVDLHRQGW